LHHEGGAEASPSLFLPELLPLGRLPPGDLPYDDRMSQARLLGWGGTAVALVFLWIGWNSGPELPGVSAFLFWVGLLVAAQVLPISLGLQAEVTMSFPLTVVAMTIAAIGALDVRELRREIPGWLALWNRSQLALAVGAASAVMHAYEGPLFDFPTGAAVIAAGVLVHFAINLGLVTLMLVSRYRDVPVGGALGTLLPKPVSGFLLSQLLLGALGVATAAAYGRIHFFVAAFLIPLLFARLSLLGARAQQELAEQVQRQQRALLDATEKVFEDREQERNRIAESIHDSALQLLVGAAYASDNSRHYIEQGRLDEAKVALESTKGAIQDAISDLRSQLTDLRKSSIEEGGLMDTIQTFAEQMRVLWSADIHIEGGTNEEPPIPVSLAAFQILQEGVINALKHSDSRSIVVRVSEYDGMVHISIEDKGPGFDTSIEPDQSHLGLRLMRERADRVGGKLELHSAPGSGTRLEAVLPGRVSR
jgi:signal transduction histidine kinase